MIYKIQNMDAFDDLFAEPPAPEPTPKVERPERPHVEDRVVGPGTNDLPPWRANPLEEKDVQLILSILDTTLEAFDPEPYKVEFEYLKELKLYEAWDWECALVTSRSLKIAILGVLQIRHQKGLSNGPSRG